jgi:hypothetical protein
MFSRLSLFIHIIGFPALQAKGLPAGFGLGAYVLFSALGLARSWLEEIDGTR